MTRACLVHLSDLHFAVRSHSWARFRHLPKDWHPWLRVDSHDPQAADAIVDLLRANAATAPIDLVLITGDLATTGERPDLEAARDFIDGSIGGRRQRQQPVLADAGVPIALLPGNHDRYLDAKCRPGGAEFDRVFGSYWSAGQRGNGVQTLWDNGLRGRERIVLIGADLTLTRRDYGGSPLGLPGRGKYGRGKLYPQRRDLLRRQTQQARSLDPGCVVLWAVHFEPYCNDTFLKLVNEAGLIRAAEAERVSLVLCGHSHRSSVRPIGRTLYSVCGTSSQAHSQDGQHLHVVSIEVDPLARPRIDVDIYRFDPQSPGLGFVPVAP